MVLANRCASGADTPPWARFIALHPGKGIALVDLDSPDAAVAPLEDFLCRTGLSALPDGAPPIVPVALQGGETGTVADRLDAALSPMQSKLGNSNWSKSTVERLLTAPDLALTRVRRVAPATEVTRAELSKYPSHGVEAWHVLLARSGMLGPDSALLEWQHRHNWRSLATVAALLLVTIGARAVQEFGPSRFQTAMPSPAAEMPDLSADVLAQAMLLPTVGATLPATILTLSQLPAPAPKLATLTPVPAPPSQAYVTPPPKPVTPASHTTETKPPPATLRPKIASKPAAPKNFMVTGDPAQNRGGGVNPAWYDQDATTPSSAGLAAFVAPGARNAALISANLGTAHLASGTTATLDFYGDGLLNIAINGKALAQAIDPSTGKPLGAAVGNTRALKAASGNVLLRANVAANVVDDVINTSGIVQASSASEHNGQIVLNGGSGGFGGAVQVVGTKDPSDNPSGQKTLVSGGPSEDQAVVYTTTAVTIAQDVTADIKPIAASVDGTVSSAVAQGTTDANATTTSVGKAAADVPTIVTHVGGTLGSTLTNTVNALTKPATSLALPTR